MQPIETAPLRACPRFILYQYKVECKDMRLSHGNASKSLQSRTVQQFAKYLERLLVGLVMDTSHCPNECLFYLLNQGEVPSPS